MIEFQYYTDRGFRTENRFLFEQQFARKIVCFFLVLRIRVCVKLKNLLFIFAYWQLAR